MLKKIFIWSLFAVLSGALIAGAVYRTSVKSADDGQTQNQGNASRQQSSGETIGNSAGKGGRESIQERSTIDGQVVGLSNRGLSVQLVNAQSIEISGRAWRYAQGLGFTAQNGDRLQLEGFLENGEFRVIHVTNLSNSQSVSLRDEGGRPLWSGNR
ncbi:MAG: hypothetical protein JW730_20895 [Anaerolineales bacterium]|nr:hypothetical protein [Anaerolineales bacterium]